MVWRVSGLKYLVQERGVHFCRGHREWNRECFMPNGPAKMQALGTAKKAMGGAQEHGAQDDRRISQSLEALRQGAHL